MADRDDLPYIVIERHSVGVGSFVYGALIGAGLALLLAPRSGRETRTELRTGVQRIRDRAEDAVRQVQETVTGTFDDVRDEVSDRIDAAREAFDAGREAARETREQMERRVRETRAGVRAGMAASRGEPDVTPITPSAAEAPILDLTEADEDTGYSV
jgi:gas vesicle protein